MWNAQLVQHALKETVLQILLFHHAHQILNVQMDKFVKVAAALLHYADQILPVEMVISAETEDVG